MYQTIHTSASAYTFTIHPVGTQFKGISAIYTFLIIPPGNHNDVDSPFYTLLYIGIATNIKTRLNSHHKIKQALSLGMTHIGILRKSSGRRRKTIEKELLKHLNPPLNQTWL